MKDMFMFTTVFQAILGLGCGLLITLLGYRLIETFFFIIGFKLGQAKNKPVSPAAGLDPVLLKQGVTEIVKEILNEGNKPAVTPTAPIS